MGDLFCRARVRKCKITRSSFARVILLKGRGENLCILRLEQHRLSFAGGKSAEVISPLSRVRQMPSAFPLWHKSLSFHIRPLFPSCTTPPIYFAFLLTLPFVRSFFFCFCSFLVNLSFAGFEVWGRREEGKGRGKAGNGKEGLTRHLKALWEKKYWLERTRKERSQTHTKRKNPYREKKKWRAWTKRRAKSVNGTFRSALSFNRTGCPLRKEPV